VAGTFPGEVPATSSATELGHLKTTSF